VLPFGNTHSSDSPSDKYLVTRESIITRSYLSDDNVNVHQKIALSPSTDTTPYLDAIIQYVHEIVATLPAPYTLFVSGGVDSQAMLYIWKKSGVPFTAINVSYNGFNNHDYSEMEQFTKTHGINVKQVDFDVLSFLENDLEKYAMTYKCSSPQICTHMAFTEKFGKGTNILSGNIPHPNLPAMNNTIFGLQRYATLANVDMVPFFLMADKRSAEIALRIANEQPESKLSPYEFKCYLYRLLGIPVISQKTKLTGFEQLKEHYDQYPERVTYKMKLRHSSLESARVFDQLFRNKYMIVLRNGYKTKFIVQK